MESGLLSNAYPGIMDHDLLTFYCAKFGTATLASYEHLITYKVMHSAVS